MANPWFRLYSEFADDPKVQMMPEEMQRRLIMLFCERCKEVKHDETLRAFHWRVTPLEVSVTRELFIKNGFIDEDWNLLNWNRRQYVSDSSTDRVRQYRERLKQKETLQEENVTPPEQKQSRTEAEQKHKKQAASAFVLPEWIDKNAWQGYEEMRKKIRKPMTDRARALAVSELVRLEARGHPAEKVLDQSTQHSWQGIFELKTNGGNGNGKPTIDASVAARQALLDRRREGRMAANGDTSGGITEARSSGAERPGVGSANGTLFRTA